MKNVLLVDDEAFILDILKTTIPWEKYDLSVSGCATDGMTALELFKTNHYDLVVTDMKMPHMSGLELIEQLHRINPNISFLVMSSYDDFHLVRKCFKYGALDYILKIDIDNPEVIEPIFNHIHSILHANTTPRPQDYSVSSFYESTSIPPYETNEYTLSQHTPFITIKTQLLESLKCLDLQTYSALFDSFLKEMKALWVTPEVMLQESYNILNYTHNNLIAYGFNPRILPALPNNIQEILKNYQTYSILSNWLKDYLFTMLDNVCNSPDCNLNILVTTYIKENYNNPDLSLQFISQATGVNKKQLSKICVNATGLHFKAFLNEVRISNAKNLLINTTFKINEIAYMVGYSNIEHFCRVFSQTVGMNPSTFQNQQLTSCPL